MTESRRPAKKLRCAIYMRKSSEEGLEQAFNSLDAQREVCTAFILSQKHEGWTVLPTLYDDGGFSSGTMDRDPQPPKGIVPHPLAVTTLPRHVKPPPTSHRTPGTAAARDLLHGHKWKRGVKETEATTREMRRKATQIAPAYNKGALQYLPGGAEKDEWS
jgi:hypothetical protein